MYHIDKTYNLPTSTMTDDQWEALGQVYRTLPSFLGAPGDHCPSWFGLEPEDESEMTPYLVASVEPSGLQVSGYLEYAVWKEWDRAFMERATAALGFSVRDASA